MYIINMGLFGIGSAYKQTTKQIIKQTTEQIIKQTHILY
jgi:hypothetical protein